MRRSTALITLFAALFLTASCATTGGKSVTQPAESRIGVGSQAGDWSVAQRKVDRGDGPPPEVRKIVEDVYTGDVDLDAIGDRIDGALDERPDSTQLHEAASLMALVNGRRHRFWYHAMTALTDVTTPVARLYLWMLETRDMTRPQRDQYMQLLRNLHESDIEADLRAYATWELAGRLRLHGRFDEAADLTESLGWIGDWQYLGPLDGGSDPMQANLAPEDELDLETTYEGVRGETSFRPVPSLDAKGEVALDSLISPRDQKVAYLVTWVKSDEARTVDVRFTTDSAVRLYVNGDAVSTFDDFEGRTFDNGIVRTPLAEGWNRLMVKTIGGGSWQVGVRLTTPEGQPLGDGVTTSREPHEVAGNIDPSRVESLRTPADLRQVEPRARRVFWQARQAARTGPYEREESKHEQFFGINEESPLALFYNYFAYPGEFPDADDRETITNLLSATETGGSGLLLERGIARNDDGEHRAALSDFRRAIDREPTNRPAWMWLSFVQDDFGWEVERCQTLHDVLDRWNSGWAHYSLADCYRDRDRTDRAARHFRRALARRPGRPGDLERLRDLARSRGNFERAAEYGQRLVAGYPIVTSYRLDLGDIEVARENYDRARSLYDSIIEQRPGWDRPYRKMADLALIRDRPEEATDWMEKAAERSPDDTTLETRLAYHRTLTGKRKGLATGVRIIHPGRLIDRRESSQPIEIGNADDWLPADSRIDEAVEAGTELDPPEGTRWVMAMDDEVTWVRDDGTAKRVVTQVRHPVTDKGRDDVLHLNVPGNGKVEILKAHTVTSEGKRLEARSIRDGQIRFRGVEKGAATVVQYIHHLDPHRVMDDHYFTSWWFQQPWGYTRSARWVVVSPTHKNFGHRIRGDQVSHRTESNDDRTVHVFEADDVPPARPEPNAINLENYLAHVYLTTLEQWDTYVQWEMDRLPDALDSSNPMADKARSLAEEQDSAQAKLHALAHWIQQEVRYEQDYEDHIARLIPHAASKVFDRKYGDCKDKAVLFIQMADVLGLDVEYALLRTRGAGSIIRELPGLYFNHAIAYVPAQNGLEEGFFVDLTSDMVGPQLLPTASQGNTALVLDPDDGDYEFRDIPYAEPGNQYEKDRLDVTVAGPDDASATWAVTAEGPSAARIRSATDRLTPQRLARAIFNRFFPGASVTGVEVGNIDDRRRPVEMTIDGDLSGAFRDVDAGYELSLPRTFRLHKLTSLKSRRMPLDLGARQRNELTMTVELGEGAEVTSMPEPVDVDGTCFSLTRTIEEQKNTATVTTTYDITCATVAPEQYESFRKAVRKAAQQSKGAMTFEFEGK